MGKEKKIQYSEKEKIDGNYRIRTNQFKTIWKIFGS